MVAGGGLARGDFMGQLPLGGIAWPCGAGAGRHQRRSYGLRGAILVSHPGSAREELSAVGRSSVACRRVRGKLMVHTGWFLTARTEVALRKG